MQGSWKKRCNCSVVATTRTCTNAIIEWIQDMLRRLQAMPNAAARLTWAHHARLEAISLAASATAHWIQAGSFGVQSAEWHVSTIFGGWLPAYLYCRPTTTLIVQRRHVSGSKNSHKSGRSFIHCVWTASVEQPTSPSTWLWIYFPRVLPVTEDALVLLSTAAPSNCFSSAL